MSIKKDEVRFHCFGACKGDWDIYDVIMLRKKYRFRTAQQVWAEHLGVKDFRSDDGSSLCIPEPDETPEPDITIGFVEPKKIDQRIFTETPENRCVMRRQRVGRKMANIMKDVVFSLVQDVRKKV